MKKKIFILAGLCLICCMTLIAIIYSNGMSENEKVAAKYLKDKGYKIVNRRGEVQKYTLENNDSANEKKISEYKVIRTIQNVDRRKYFGKEITVYCFTVVNHPLEKVTGVNTNVYVMMADGKVVGGYSFPNAYMQGGLSSIDGKSLEEVTGMSYKEWGENWYKLPKSN